MTIIAQDPGLHDKDGIIVTTEVEVPAEDLDSGPRGYRVFVIDYDASTGTFDRPFELPPGRDPYRPYYDEEPTTEDKRLHPGTGNKLQEFCGEQRVAILDKISLAVQDAVVPIREIPANLAHPQARCGRRDPGNLDLAWGQLDEEQHQEPLQPSPISSSAGFLSEAGK